jgi:Gluconate 2-dehydrogenase subunit 3
MADLIIPRTEMPGAKDVRVNQFLDHIVADWFSGEERTRFLAGLDDVDARTQKLFQRNFIDATFAQQAEILRALGEEMQAAAAILANGPRAERGTIRQPIDNFYFVFRSLTLQGYFTSEAGFTQQLHKEIIPGRFDGCIPFHPAAPSAGT